MKCAYFVLCFAVGSQAFVPLYEGDNVHGFDTICSKWNELNPALAVSRPVSQGNDNRAEILQSRESAASLFNIVFDKLENLTQKLNAIEYFVSSIHSLFRPVVPPTCTMLPRSGVPDSKKTYFICDQFANAFVAEAYCQQYEMSLAMMEDEAVYNYLSPHLIAFRKTLGPWKNEDGFFLAASDKNTHGKWYWTPSNTPFTFSVWGENEPSGNGEHCLELRQTGEDTPLTFNDYWCENERRFLCEHKSI